MAGRGQLVKMPIALEQYGIFGSFFAYLYILTLSRHWYMQNGDEASPSIISVVQGLLVKLLINLEMHGII